MLVNLELESRAVLVIGAGGVATRRVGALLAAGAWVRVIAPQVSSEIEAWSAAGKLDLQRRAWLATDPDTAPAAEGWALLVCAVDDAAVDDAVQSAARRAGIPVSSALGGGTVSHPALRRHGPVQVAVETGGRSPALAAELADRLEECLKQQLPPERIAAFEAAGWPRDRAAVQRLLGGAA